jgi:hypothetical protein
MEGATGSIPVPPTITFNDLNAALLQSNLCGTSPEARYWGVAFDISLVCS